MVTRGNTRGSIMAQKWDYSLAGWASKFNPATSMSDQDKFLSTIKYKIMQTSDGIIEYIN